MPLIGLLVNQARLRKEFDFKNMTIETSKTKANSKKTGKNRGKEI